MAKKFASMEPLYSMGAAFVEFGEVLMDSRSRVTEIAALAHRCGLRLCIEVSADPQLSVTDAEKDSPDGR